MKLTSVCMEVIAIAYGLGCKSFYRASGILGGALDTLHAPRGILRTVLYSLSVVLEQGVPVIRLCPRYEECRWTVRRYRNQRPWEHTYVTFCCNDGNERMRTELDKGGGVESKLFSPPSSLPGEWSKRLSGLTGTGMRAAIYRHHIKTTWTYEHNIRFSIFC
jgi:hypothetical protein